MAPRFVFPIKDLEYKTVEVHEPLPEHWLAEALGDTEVEATPGATGSVDVSLSMTGRDVVVRGTVDAPVTLPCARCMKQVEVSVRGDLSLLLVPGKAPLAGASEQAGTDDKIKGKKSKRGKRAAKREDDDGHVIDSQEADWDTYIGEEVCLDAFLREAILLDVPIFPLCSETCPGIGAVSSEAAGSAGEEDAIDPRLAPLLELKKKSRI